MVTVSRPTLHQSLARTALSVLALLCAAGCYDIRPLPSESEGGAGSVSEYERVWLVPDVVERGTGVTVRLADPLVNGYWDSYSDREDCSGEYDIGACSRIDVPCDGAARCKFEATHHGRLCVQGVTAEVLGNEDEEEPDPDDQPTWCPDPPKVDYLDYERMWGAGIQLWFEDVEVSDVVGFGFNLYSLRDFEAMRVQLLFDVAGERSDRCLASSPYWGAKQNELYEPSPVKVGWNTVLWDEIEWPTKRGGQINPAWTRAIQFHVPTAEKASTPFEFCVGEVALLREK